MEEFAEVSGISRPTISKYFYDPESVRQSSRARIESALEKYDYRPNIFAINQNRKLTKTIGILVPYLADPFFAEIVRMIERQCINAGYWPIVFSAHGEKVALENKALIDTSITPTRRCADCAALGRNSDIRKRRAAVHRRSADVLSFDSNVPVGQGIRGL